MSIASSHNSFGPGEIAGHCNLQVVFVSGDDSNFQTISARYFDVVGRAASVRRMSRKNSVTRKALGRLGAK
jgi:hypothetical protein